MAGFEDRAADWIRFARTEGHDSYWLYRDAFFGVLLPPPARTLELGCGERRVARDLAARGRALEEAGLAIEALREPPPPGDEPHRRRRIPLFLLWRARKLGVGG